MNFLELINTVYTGNLQQGEKSKNSQNEENKKSNQNLVPLLNFLLNFFRAQTKRDSQLTPGIIFIFCYHAKLNSKITVRVRKKF